MQEFLYHDNHNAHNIFKSNSSAQVQKGADYSIICSLGCLLSITLEPKCTANYKHYHTRLFQYISEDISIVFISG